ncbi:glucose-6-phosphate isomerase [Synechococcales cyanobacterium C]|uniref:Glucose-6-phosphate isomerase n=1 Tax=Petrachloros mirabilis ULC683 TaxID=2781853 RepID=A0A8K2A828_9CYAN|nr:glucose-6-phosphate isomerase [Petrachloros mirabilis]NCJ07564.1 glucose-6-phosphate isomerase [Petrachloros mirabilis ULC683]
MDAVSLWQRYQNWLYYHSALGIYIDISRMRFTDADVAALTSKFDQAFTDMVALEAGAIANPDENRMVGHYWLRDPDRAPTPELRSEIIDTLKQVENFAQGVMFGSVKPPYAERFTDVISIGIGGSALGPQFVSQALAPPDAPLQLHFLDNSDPTGIDQVLDALQDRLATTLVLTISKSGGTPETRNGMLEVRHRFESEGFHFPNHAVAITGVGSQLDQIAQAEGWLASFPMQDWVGGRTSELSTVGLVPAALQGIAIHEMLAGAKQMDEATRVADLKHNPAALLALSWYVAGGGRGQKDMVVLPYKDSLLLFSRYLQQLVMESLGKERDLEGRVVHQGIAVYGNKGSTDQHAYVQQLRDGLPNFFLTFIEVLKDRGGQSPELEPGITSGDYLSGFLLGTREALYDNERDSITITLPEVTPRMVGALIALYERAVGLYASLIHVNAYHQPGVEAGKKAAAATLALQQQVMHVLKTAQEPLLLQEIAEQAQAGDRVETVYKILRHLHANERGIVLSGDLSQPDQLRITLS